MLHIGCHLSAANGYLAMGKDALSISADTFQFFTRNPRGGSAKAIDPADAQALLELMREHHFAPILAHAPYTLNPCSAEENIREFAFMVLTDDLKRMEFTPGNLYNFHPGSHVGQGVEKGISLITDLLNRVLTGAETTTVLLETMAGKGSEVGSRFEELKEIIHRTEHGDKLGVCLDTCHVYDAGYDVVQDFSGVLDEFDQIIGLQRLKAIHVNDSMNPFSSHKDRHQKIGQGSFGLEAFARILNEPRVKGIPLYLETPNDLDGHREEITLLKSLYTGDET